MDVVRYSEYFYVEREEGICLCFSRQQNWIDIGSYCVCVLKDGQGFRNHLAQEANNFSFVSQLQTIGSDHLENCVEKDSEAKSKVTRAEKCCHW